MGMTASAKNNKLQKEEEKLREKVGRYCKFEYLSLNERTRQKFQAAISSKVLFIGKCCFLN